MTYVPARNTIFLSLALSFADVRGDFTSGPVLEHPQQMPGARFFPNARLNFAENLLKFDDEQPALVFRNERGGFVSSRRERERARRRAVLSQKIV